MKSSRPSPVTVVRRFIGLAMTSKFIVPLFMAITEGGQGRDRGKRKGSPPHHLGATPDNQADSDDQLVPRCKQRLISNSSTLETQPGQLQ